MFELNGMGKMSPEEMKAFIEGIKKKGNDVEVRAISLDGSKLPKEIQDMISMINASNPFADAKAVIDDIKGSDDFKEADRKLKRSMEISHELRAMAEKHSDEYTPLMVSLISRVITAEREKKMKSITEALQDKASADLLRAFFVDPSNGMKDSIYSSESLNELTEIGKSVVDDYVAEGAGIYELLVIFGSAFSKVLMNLEK